MLTSRVTNWWAEKKTKKKEISFSVVHHENERRKEFATVTAREEGGVIIPLAEVPGKMCVTCMRVRERERERQRERERERQEIDTQQTMTRFTMLRGPSAALFNFGAPAAKLLMLPYTQLASV